MFTCGRSWEEKDLKKRLIQVLIFVILIAGIIGYMAIDKMKEKYTPTTEHMDLYTYFGVEEDDDRVIIFLNNVKTEGDAVVKDGKVYISHAMVEEYFSENFYWDESAKQLLYSTATVLYKYSLDSNKYNVNGEEKLSDAPMVISEGESIYLCMDFVQEYADVQYSFFEEPNRLMLVNEWKDVEYVEVNEDAGIRKLGGIKSPIVIDAKAGEKYLYINEIDEWTCVQDEAGVKGYIETKYTGEKTTKTLASNYVEPVYSNISRDYKINLAWHQVTNKDANANLSKVMEGVKGVNVISPTWFQMCDNGGNIISLASQDYVNKAHSMGLEVWALVENITDVEMYSKYREWALSVNDSTGASVAGAEAVKASPNAWLSFALGSSTLIADEPVDGEVAIDSIGTISSDGTMAFTVSIEDIAVGDGALEENLKKVFNIEGTTSIGDSSSFSSDNVEIHLAEPVDGKVKFTVSPKGSPNTFFIRSKLIK